MSGQEVLDIGAVRGCDFTAYTGLYLKEFEDHSFAWRLGGRGRQLEYRGFRQYNPYIRIVPWTANPTLAAKA